MTTPITLTGPDNCAQCGAQIDAEAVLAEVMVTGTSDAVNAAYVVIRGHKVNIPGLYWDKACGSRIESGELEPALTLGAAQAFLNDNWGPSIVDAGLKATLAGNGELSRAAAARLADVLEVSFMLEVVIEAMNEGDDLSWLPECDGYSHDQDEEVDPRSVAHLN